MQLARSRCTTTTQRAHRSNLRGAARKHVLLKRIPQTTTHVLQAEPATMPARRQALSGMPLTQHGTCCLHDRNTKAAIWQAGQTAGQKGGRQHLVHNSTVAGWHGTQGGRRRGCQLVLDRSRMSAPAAAAADADCSGVNCSIHLSTRIVRDSSSSMSGRLGRSSTLRNPWGCPISSQHLHRNTLQAAPRPILTGPETGSTSAQHLGYPGRGRRLQPAGG